MRIIHVLALMWSSLLLTCVVISLLSSNVVQGILPIYSKDVLNWSIKLDTIQYSWNDSFVDSGQVVKGFLTPTKPIVFVQQHLAAFSWKSINDEFRIYTMDDLVNFVRNDSNSASTRMLKIGVDRQYALLFRDFLNYNQIPITTNMEKSQYDGQSFSIIPFTFFRRNCRPRHVLEDFDMFITSPGTFLELVRYYRESSGKRKEISVMTNENTWNESSLINPTDFLPIKLVPAILGYEYPVYPYFLLVNSSYLHGQNSYFVSDIITLYQHYEFGKLSSQDIDFLNYLVHVNSDSNLNFTLDEQAFNQMIQNTETYLNYSLPQLSLEQVYSNYFSSAFHYCTDSACNNYQATSDDFWNIPVLLIVTLYFIALFGSTLFLKDSFKRRMMVPYLPVTIYFFELTHSDYFTKSCLQALSFVRMFVITWIIGVYILTVMRFYMLRNLYSILNNPLVVNKRIAEIQIVKRLVSPINSLLLIIFISSAVSVLVSIHGVVMFFDLFYAEEDTFSVVNISFVVYILVGCSLGVLTVLVDFIVNWKVIKTKGLLSFLRFDDPFKVRLDLISMALLLIVAIIHASTGADYQRVFFFLECVLFLFMCGGFTLLFEILHKILQRRNQQQLSELENFLKDQNFTKLFKDFASKEFSLENIMFYEKIRNLKQVFGSSAIEKSTIEEIENDFIASNSKFELNIPSSTRRSYIELKKSDSPTANELFEIFFSDVIVNLNDTLGRLMETSEFNYWHEIYKVQCVNNAANNL